MSSGNEDSLGKIIKTEEQAREFIRNLKQAGKIQRPLTFSELLEGTDILVKTDVGEVRVTIDKVEIETRTIVTGESKPENDWWPESHSYEVYRFTFTNKTSKVFDSFKDIKFYI
jgi:hypothetical protein